ncbi:MAG: hypothetical protein WCC87_16360 [Candidatus Korobacteraceae bacterium]
MTKKARNLLLAAALICGGIAVAQMPVQNISAQRHPNLAAAQSLCVQAYEKIEAARTANDFDMQGHAKKAQQLLVQASEELKLSALAANQK